MASWQVSEEAVRAIRSTSAQLEKAVEKTAREEGLLAAVFEENEDGLGAHAAAIRTLLEELRTLEKEAEMPVKKLMLRLQRAAFIRQRHIDQNAYGGGSGPQKGAAPAAAKENVSSGGGREVSAAERTIFELDTLARELELTDGDPGVLQLGGYHRDVAGTVAGTGYQSHHIPAQSVFADNKNGLPTIAMTAPDHRQTSSFGGRMNRPYRPFLPDGLEHPRHKDSVREQVEQGFLAEVIRKEIYELQEQYGDKYDGAIKQYIAAMKEYIRKNGVPKVKGHR